MPKLVVTCSACGLKSRVSMLAIGKVGLCPYCKNKNRISPSNSQPEGMGDYVGPGNQGAGPQAPPGAMQAHIEQFARAVDLFNRAYYAEALAIFDALAAALPDNSDVLFARRQCMEAIKRPRLEAPSPGGSETKASGAQADTGGFDEETVKRIVRDKLLAGGSKSDEVQLKAAEIAARILGMTRQATPASASDGLHAAGGPEPKAASGSGLGDRPDDVDKGGNGSARMHQEDAKREEELSPDMWPPEYPEGQADSQR